jgi:hypothetical protein
LARHLQETWFVISFQRDISEITLGEEIKMRAIAPAVVAMQIALETRFCRRLAGL